MWDIDIEGGPHLRNGRSMLILSVPTQVMSCCGQIMASVCARL